MQPKQSDRVEALGRGIWRHVNVLKLAGAPDSNVAVSQRRGQVNVDIGGLTGCNVMTKLRNAIDYDEAESEEFALG